MPALPVGQSSEPDGQNYDSDQHHASHLLSAEDSYFWLDPLPGEESLETVHIVRSDVLHITLSDLGLSKSSVLVDDRLNRPSNDVSDDSNSAACTMLAMVTVDQHRVIVLVENGLHDLGHESLGNRNFLGSRHVDDNVVDVVPLHEVQEFGVEVLLNKGADDHQHSVTRSHSSQTHKIVFNPRVFRYWKSSGIGMLLR